MKKIYLYLAIITIVAITLLALSFLYIDRQGRQTFLYAIYCDNILSGYEKIDRYLVENKLIYKSSIELARDILSGKKTQKIIFDANGKNLIDYSEETAENGTKSTAYIKNSGDSVSFLGISSARFTCLDSMPVRGNFTIFNKKSIVTYSPLIRRYNFRKRGEQFFNTLTVASLDLPPVPGVVSITAIGKDMINIDDKKVKCENLVFELENGDLISVWIATTFRNILMVKIPKSGFKAVLTTKKDTIPVEEYSKKSDQYTEKEVIFKNGDIVLNGVLSIPAAKNGPYPVILLIWDKGPMDNNALGAFTDIAGALAENGYCAFRFDKRGVGKSQGFFSTYDQSEEIDDLKKAVEFLKSAYEIDKDRIGVLGYAEGAFYATYLTGAEDGIRACILLAASASMNPLKDDSKRLKEYVEKNVSDDPKYIEDAIKALTQSKQIGMEQGDWITIEDTSVFTKKVKMQDSYDMTEALTKVKAPVLIIQGEKDGITPPEDARVIESALSQNGNNNVTLIYLGDLDHLLGRIVKTGNIREHIEIDPAVIKNILSWLDKNLTLPKTADTELSEGASQSTSETGNTQDLPTGQ